MWAQQMEKSRMKGSPANSEVMKSKKLQGRNTIWMLFCGVEGKTREEQKQPTQQTTCTPHLLSRSTDQTRKIT